MRWLSAFLVLVSSFSLMAEQAQVCPAACDRPSDCSKQFYIGSKKIQIYSNYPLNVSNSCIDSVIYAMHGTERDAEARYDQVLDDAKSYGLERRTLIISPFFRTDLDAPTSTDYYWSTSGWKQGNTSNNSGTQISSFAVADTILDTVIDGGKFPYITRATVTGHSAGGQYTQMYALTTSEPEDHPEVDFQFLVLNPSNYTYLNNLRPYPNITNYFELPVYLSGSKWKMKPDYLNAAGNCPTTFNNFKYGMDNRNAYANRLTSLELILQYLPRRVFYFVGELDNDPLNDSLDTSCSAELQGPHRLARAQNYFNFLNTYYSGHSHYLRTVPGVAHEARKMYESDVLKPVLFWLYSAYHKDPNR